MDSIGRNPLNAKADKVVECSKVSFYKGVPVYRANLPSSFSFAAILLDTSDVNETTVKHEYSHNVVFGIIVTYIKRSYDMKKKISVILTALSLMLFTGCKEFIHYYDYKDISDNLTKAEIVFYEYDGSVSAIIKSLEYDESLDLLYDYSQLYFKEDMPVYGGPKSHYGKAIRAFYTDESCRIFTVRGEITQSWAICDETEYLSIIDKYS